MKDEPKSQKFPWWAIPLIALASFRFEYRWESGSSFTYDGTATALLIIGVILAVMVFRVTKRVQEVLKARNLISEVPRSPLWSLLPFSILLPAIGYGAISQKGFTDPFSHKYVRHWDFHWGATPLHVWLVFGTLGMIFLHTAILTVKEIERSTNDS
jgi:hypothetical protein